MSKIKKIKKRDGSIQKFDPQKITKAIWSAAQAVGGTNKDLAKDLTEKIVKKLENKTDKGEIPTVETVQDIVEKQLVEHGHYKTAKAYILYRFQHTQLREFDETLSNTSLIDNYIREKDWRVKENSNMSYSLQGLNVHIADKVVKKYWLEKIYPPEVRKEHNNSFLHIHDLGTLGVYCVGWDLEDILLSGFKGVRGKIESAPAKHFNVALLQVVNYIYTLQGESAGAQALSNFDTLLAPFIRYDDLSYKEAKQCMQEFLYNMNVPTRVGFQSPFSNVTMDLKVPAYLKDQSVIIGGEPQDETYGEFQKEIDMFNRIFAELMLEGDAKDRPFTFPIPTYNITKDFEWDNKILDPLWEMTSKYGTPYFSNFINSDMKPEDARSMCPIAGDEKVLIKSSRGRGLEYSKIRNVYEGNGNNKDYEIFSDGKFVKGKFNKFENQEMIKVILSNGHELKMTKEHLNFVIEKKGGELKELKGKELKQGMYLPYSLKAYKGEGGKKDLGFFVGAYAGDGSLDSGTVVFSLNQNQKKVIKKLQNIAQKYFGAHYSTSQNNKLFTLKIHSRAAVGICKDYVKGKKRNKHYRARLYTTSKEFRKGVIDGHYATDGGNRHRIYTSSKKMVESLNMLGASLGTTTSVYKDDREGRLGEESNYAVLIYQLNRKSYGKFWFKKDDKLWVKIKLIKNISNKTAYCFEVKNGEPMFTVGTTGVLTHNCRLRLDNKELRKRGGGLFGSNPLTGSIGVVTLNMPRIAYLSDNEDQFFNRVEDLMEKAKKSLLIKRKVLEDLTKKGLYPYSKFYLRKVKESQGEYWKNHFSTIGLIGANDALLNLKDTNIGTKEGSKFAEKVLEFMRDKLSDFQKETGDIFNLEATPAEGSSYRLARNDKKEFDDIKIYNIDVLGKEEPVYTNSTQLPFGLTEDIFEALDLQDPLQTKYTGGCIEKGNKVLTNKGAMNIEKIVSNFDNLKPIKVLSYNSEKGISEWDKVEDAMKINIKKHDKVRIKAERGLDITTSDWHPFFVKEKIKPKKNCPICDQNVKGIKGFANHVKNNPECRKKYTKLSDYKIIEKRADELEKDDYILQNSQNLYPDKNTEINKDLMWLIGFFIGDGCISKYIDNKGNNNLERYKVRFFSEHKKPLKKAKNILKKHFNCKAHIISNDKRSDKLLEISTSKKEVWKFFFDLGFSDGEKVYNISVPQKVKNNLNQDNVFDLLSGLADSDGHIDKKQGDFEYYTVSKNLADNLIAIFSQAGLMVGKKLKRVKRENEKNIYRIRIPNYEMTRIKDKLNITVNKSRINKNISNRTKRHFPVVRVQSVSKVDVKDNNFYDLTTIKNHNYLAGKNTMVFIHNTVFHTWLGEKMPSIEATKNLVKKIANNYSLPYYTLTPTFSICPIHGYINGEEKYCPKCKDEGKTTKCEVYSRIVGYLRPVEQWNEGKQEEFKDRANFSKSAK